MPGSGGRIIVTMSAVTSKHASARRRLRVVMMWTAVVFAVVGTVVCLLTSRGTAPFQAGAILAGLGAGVAVGLPVAMGLTRLVERSGPSRRR